MLYLRLPVEIQTCGEHLCGEVYLPSRMRGLSICADRGGRPASLQWVCEQLSNVGMATLIVHASQGFSANQLIAAIDWTRAKRLLRTLPINLIATSTDSQAAKKAAELRPAAVKAVLTGEPSVAHPNLALVR